MRTLGNFLLGILFFTCTYTQAQVNINVNLGNPPAWGPAGYTDVRYYYLPDIETYYDVGTRQYIYLTNGKWMRATTLPVVYRNYNLYNGYKVVVHDYRGATPYVYYKTHKAKYPKGFKGKPQKTVGIPPGHAKKIVGKQNASVKHHAVAKGKGHNDHKHGKGKHKEKH